MLIQILLGAGALLSLCLVIILASRQNIGVYCGMSQPTNTNEKPKHPTFEAFICLLFIVIGLICVIQLFV